MSVTCAGILVADVVRRFRERAEPGRLVTLEEPITLHVGGCAANTGICLSKMGIESRIVGKIGRDYWGRFVIETLKGHDRIDVTGVTYADSAMTATTDIEVDIETGDRTFYHYVGANAEFSTDDISDQSFDCEVFHMGGYNLVPRITPQRLRSLFSKAHSSGCSTSIDLAWSDQVDWTQLQSAMDQIDYYFSNIDEARMVLADTDSSVDQISASIMSMGPQVVAIKRGVDGCHIRTQDSVVDMPSDPQFKAVDGTGAGDAFVAGMLLGICEGWDIGKTARFANAAGGFCVSKPGATSGVPDRKTILNFVESNELSYSIRPGESE